MDPIIQKLIDASLTGQRCQRNWDLSQTIDDTILSTLKEVVKNSATKQNEEYYDVFFITKRSLIEKIFDLTDTSVPGKNSQTLAQLLVVFNGRVPDTSRDWVDPMTDVMLQLNQHQSVGIVSGQLVLAANLLGLRTGFCACFDFSKLSKLLAINSPLLIVGVGIPDDTKIRTAHQFSTKENNYKNYTTYNKPITITLVGETDTTVEHTSALPNYDYTRSVTVIAPTNQQPKNVKDIMMLSPELLQLWDNILYKAGVDLKIDPRPFNTGWNNDNTVYTATWHGPKDNLDKFMDIIQSQFERTLLTHMGNLWSINF